MFLWGGNERSNEEVIYSNTSPNLNPINGVT